MPIGFGSHGYQSLVEEFEDEAPFVYGAWCALVSLAAEQTWRGYLCTSKKEPFSISRIARLTYFPRDAFEKLIAWATSESVGWIEVTEQRVVDALTIGEQPGDDASPPGQQPVDDVATERNVTVPNLTLPDGTERNGTAPPDIVSQEDLNKRKLAIAELAQQVIETVARQNERLVPRNRELAYKAAAFEFEPRLNGYLPTLLEKLQSKIRGPDPPKRPWGYLKSEMLRECKGRNVPFDDLWKSIQVPQPKPKAATQNP